MAQEVVIDIKADSKQAEANLNDVVDALKDIKKAVEGNSKAIEEQKENTSKLAQNFKKVSSAVKGFGLALKAAGIGLAIEAFNFLRDAVESNQKFANGLSKAFETLNTVLGVLLESLEPLVDIFKNIGQAIRAIVTRDFEALKNIGSELIDNFKNLGRNIGDFGSNLGETVETANEFADALVKMRNETKLATAEAERQLFIYQRQAEILRQVRDDESKSIEERIEANKQLGELLDRQYQTELSLRQKNLELAEFELSMNKENVDLQIAAIEAQTQLADLQERITGQRSEQLKNINALLREKAELEGTNVEKDYESEIDFLDKAFDAFLADSNRRIFTKKKENEILEGFDKKLTDTQSQQLEIRKDNEVNLAQESFAVASNAITSLIDLNKSKTVFDDKTAKQQFDQQKKLQLLQATVNTAGGIVSSFVPYIPILSEARAAVVATAGATQIAVIKKQQYESNAAGNFPRTSFGVNTGGSGFNPLTPTVTTPTGIQDVNVVNQQSGVRAYVVENDITNSQALTKTLNRRSRL